MPDGASLHSSDDPALRAASDGARATFGYFWRELSWEYRRVVPALQNAIVKAAFTDADATEHMWLGDIGFDGLNVTGTLVNDPLELSTVAAGDPVAVALDDVEDWMLMAGDTAYGGFTVHAIRATMGHRERQEHDRAWGLRFPDTPLVVIDQEQHPEHLDDHPMCLNVRADFAAHLQTRPDLATTRDDDGYTHLQREAIAGNAPLVTLLLALGADVDAVSPVGLTAAQHAERLGWQRVLDALAS